MKVRPVFVILISLPWVLSYTRSLSDYGGDVSQYMSLLQGTSAFSFKPGAGGMSPKDEEDLEDDRLDLLERRSEMGEGKTAMGDFGGDYGDYLKLLEGNSALGFNPQSDPISDNQDMQSDVFGGGGMSGKFWDMYKGQSSYDSFDESDSESVEGLGINESVRDFKEKRQAGEEDQPEDRGSREELAKGKKMPIPKQDESVIIAYKPEKGKMKQLYTTAMKAIKAKDKAKLNDIIESLDINELINSNKDRRSLEMEGRKIMYLQDETEEVEKEDQSRTLGLKKELDRFIKKFSTNVPDPITTTHGLSMNFRNLTLYGLTDLHVCGKIRKQFGTKWTSDICLPKLSVAVNTVTGPGVPFKGRVAAIFKQPKMHISFQEKDSAIHIQSLKSQFKGSKFVPTYDSSVPLNPWSKVSMSGYMVARVKKVLPRLVDKTLLKLMHIVERLDKEE